MKLIQLIAVGITAAFAFCCSADEFSDKGRQVFEKNKAAVVTVQIVVKNKVLVPGRSEQSSESRQTGTGTVIDPSGLTVLSLSAIDPGQLLQQMMSGEDNRFKVESEVSDVKILQEDGTEIPAEVVLRDKDLDLAFIRPKGKLDKAMQAIDLKNSTKAQLLDQVVSLNRLGGAAGRAYSISAERVSAIVQRPRFFYVPDSNSTATSLGSPAFSLDGKVLGVFVMRALKEQGSSSNPFNAQGGNVTTIILPAENVMRAAAQVPGQGDGAAKEAAQADGQ